MSYLTHPEQDREGRRRIVEQQFGHVDGRSAMRVAQQVVSMASSKQAQSTSKPLEQFQLGFKFRPKRQRFVLALSQ